MKVLIFDTETTGLPKTKIMCEEYLEKWPHIVQFSFIIFDTIKNGITLSKDFIIQIDDNIEIPQESINIHGVTNQISKEKGVNIEYVLKEFFYYLREVDQLIGHNVYFDINMLKIELLRIIHKKKYPQHHISAYKFDLHFLTNYENIYCTLQESIDLCNIKAIDKFGKEYIKYPKLSELHYSLFGVVPKNLHNSLIDILITLRCYIKMEFNKDLLLICNEFSEITEKLALF